MKVYIAQKLSQLLAPSILLICIRVGLSNQRANKTYTTINISSSNNSSVDVPKIQSSTKVPDEIFDLRANNFSEEINILGNVTSFTNETSILQKKRNETFSESPILNIKTDSVNDSNISENWTVLTTTLNNTAVDHEPSKSLYGVFNNISTNLKPNKSIPTIIPSIKSSLTLQQIKLLERNFKFMLLSRTGSHQNELDDVMTEDEPFGSAIWRDKKYLSVMIPIGVGITGAMIIIVMTFASKIRKKNSSEARTPIIPRIFTQSTSAENKPDDVILLKESSDDEF